MRPLILVLLLLVGLAAMWSGAAVRTTVAAQEAPAPVTLTQEVYERIEPGLTEQEVFDLIGCDATCSYDGVGRVDGTRSFRNLRWSDEEKRTITVCFTDGIVTAKYQAGITGE